jgi:hypothetical protein
MAEHDVERAWHAHWLPLFDEVERERPSTDWVFVPTETYDQIKRELFDFYTLVRKLPGFFDDVTNGHVTKPNTDLDVVREFIIKRIEESYSDGHADGKGEAEDDRWQDGYDNGYQDGNDRGFEDGLDEARNRI